jgi:hypothetical protein
LTNIHRQRLQIITREARDARVKIRTNTKSNSKNNAKAAQVRTNAKIKTTFLTG